MARIGFERVLYRKPGRGIKLSELSGGPDHVICATDLHAGEHVYFSRRFIYSYRFGMSEPGDVTVAAAVQASAAFPPVFLPARIPARRLGPSRVNRRKEAAGARSLVLTDGGLYDNMADQWASGLADRAAREGLGGAFREAEELVVVNSSEGFGWHGTRLLRMPILGELASWRATSPCSTTTATAFVASTSSIISIRPPGMAIIPPGGVLAHHASAAYS